MEFQSAFQPEDEEEVDVFALASNVVVLPCNVINVCRLMLVVVDGSVDEFLSPFP